MNTTQITILCVSVIALSVVIFGRDLVTEYVPPPKPNGIHFHYHHHGLLVDEDLDADFQTNNPEAVSNIQTALDHIRK